MKAVSLLLLAVCVLGIACGRSPRRQVQETVRTFDGLELPRDSIEVTSVQQTGDEMVAEIEVKTAVRMTRSGKEWVIREVRLGDRRWEKAEHILAVLQQQRSETTRRRLGDLAQGIERYRRIQGRTPVSENLEELVDLLTPQYMTEVIRLDAWSNPIVYSKTTSAGFELRSAGPDGELATSDDLVIETR